MRDAYKADGEPDKEEEDDDSDERVEGQHREPIAIHQTDYGYAEQERVAALCETPIKQSAVSLTAARSKPDVAEEDWPVGYGVRYACRHSTWPEATHTASAEDLVESEQRLDNGNMRIARTCCVRTWPYLTLDSDDIQTANGSGNIHRYGYAFSLRTRRRPKVVRVGRVTHGCAQWPHRLNISECTCLCGEPLKYPDQLCENCYARLHDALPICDESVRTAMPAKLPGIIDRTSEAIDAMPDELRKLVLMRFAENLKIAEIANKLDCSQRTVDLRIDDAKKWIRERLESEASEVELTVWHPGVVAYVERQKELKLSGQRVFFSNE